MNQPKTIARVQSSQPPGPFKTLAEWEAWRTAENERMWALVEAQLAAHPDLRTQFITAYEPS